MRLRRRIITSVVLVAIAACSDETTPTTLDGGELEAFASLDLVLPILAPETFVATDTSSSPPADGPARTWEEPPPPEDPQPDYALPVSAIWGERTGAIFNADHLRVWGEHHYQGNVGSVETTGVIRFGGQIVGTQTRKKQDSGVFVFDLGFPHYILNPLEVYTDRNCGLDGYGTSVHEASWEAVIAGPVFEFTRTLRGSGSPLVHQPSCLPDPDTYGGGGIGGYDPYDGRTICFFYIEYDLYTGEIYENEFLFCTTGG